PSPAFAQEKPAEPTRVEEGAAKRTVRIHGTAVALDQAGAARADADGRLQIYHFVDGVIEVPVRRGTWEAFCTTEARFTIRDLELGGRSVSLLHHSFAPPLDRSFDPKGPWIADHVVHVVDEKTGEPLTGIELVKQPEREGYARHPGVLRPELVVATE